MCDATTALCGMTECTIPATESVPDSVPQSRRMTQSFYKASGFVNGTCHVPPVDSEYALNSSRSASTIVVQSNKKTVVENCYSSSARPKSRRRRKGLGSKKRSRLWPPPVDTAIWPTHPAEDEDWEKDIQEVVLVDWEKRTFGLQPYGPEDLLSFALRDVSLHPTAPPITAGYTPARSHPPPILWKCYSVPREEGQFSDVDE
ncbi:unnamed protein product [Arctogadus glacialis]